MAKQQLTIDPHVAERLRQEPIIWLSSVRPDQRPHLVPVWFVWDGSEAILIVSEPENQKIRNIRQNNHVTLALETAQGGDDVVLIEGDAELVEDETLAFQISHPTLAVAYIEKYGQKIEQMGQTLESLIMSYRQPIHITLTRIVSWTE